MSQIDKLNSSKNFLKNNENMQESDNNLNLCNYLLNSLDSNEKFGDTVQKLKNNDKYFYKLNKLYKYNDFCKIIITNSKTNLKFYIFENGFYVMSKKSNLFIYLNDNKINELNELINGCKN